jgi:rhodanese-related sulfurtransferase
MDMNMTEEATTGASELDPARVGELVGEGATLIDTRRDHEWDGGRIAGARHLEINELSAQADSIPRDRPVIFYCRSGGRSRMAADAFRLAAYDAYNLAGGIRAWVEAGLPLEPADGEVREPLPAT